jgi:charged multivesicular body protein 7
MTTPSTPSSSFRPQTLESLLSGSSALATPSPERIRALYAFTSKQKLSNPAGYEKNHRWWVDTVEEALREGLLGAEEGLDKFILDGDEDALLSRLEWLDGKSGARLRPKGLGGVLVRLPCAPDRS